MESSILVLKKVCRKTQTSKLVLLIAGLLFVFTVFQLENSTFPFIQIPFPGIMNKPRSSFSNNSSNTTESASSVSKTGGSKNVTADDGSSASSTISDSTIVNNPGVEENEKKKKRRRRKKPMEVLSISDMDNLLSKNRASSKSMIPRWRPSEVDQEMLYAKTEIENAPLVTNDEQLFAPIFRNLSTFKRSYELMEKMLKVYVYKDGDKPVFHEPFFVGIYASEGWFMKQMVGSTDFLVDDPNKAHLFYIPLSSTKLRFHMYIANSHSRKNIVEHLKSYVKLVSSNYPFWNRTDGADHFLAGCHDWATDETEHSMKTTLRALCNADVHLGFEIGKDISLPTTKIFQKLNPQLNIGGKPSHKRTTLAFFAGQMHGYLRPILVQYWEKKDPNMVISGPLPKAIKMNNSETNKPTMISPYLHYMRSSKYCICPRGYEVNSPRVMEAIYHGCVPVLISDNFVPPLFEVLNWPAFSVIVPEKDVPRLKEVLMGIPRQRYLELGRGVREVRKHFLWNTKPVKYDLFHMILHSMWLNRMYV